MKYLVTGAAGFIGSHFVRQLLAGEYSAILTGDVTGVTVYDKLTYAGNLENLASVSDDPRFTFVQGDICDGPKLDEVLPGHDVVINFAAETHVDRSIHGPQDFVVTNVVGTQTLLDAALRHGIPRTVHIGTDEVYG
ncbi:MAG: GDP-mannose 4,6-dehydratase, partial [Candidatus Nanopelagicales bacterium]|nr:GDP-mannose 4,6-dehydratase [Candidatus Nanopelagicales bacterium]